MLNTLEVVGGQDAGLPVYPYGAEDRLDSHHFVPWERRRWLNSGMRLQGTPECRAIFLDLIWISYDQSPIGTLPADKVMLAKLTMIDRDHFSALCALPFGPLHKWEHCECEGGEVRLFHPMVLSTLNDAMARREDYRAKSEAASAARRLLRLRATLTGYNADLGKNDAAVRFIDHWLAEQGCAKRSPDWIERGISAWSNHSFNHARRRP